MKRKINKDWREQKDSIYKYMKSKRATINISKSTKKKMLALKGQYSFDMFILTILYDYHKAMGGTKTWREFAKGDC
jgi:hypothetical protein